MIRRRWESTDSSKARVLTSEVGHSYALDALTGLSRLQLPRHLSYSVPLAFLRSTKLRLHAFDNTVPADRRHHHVVSVLPGHFFDVRDGALKFN